MLFRTDVHSRLVVAGLDNRYSWSQIPLPVTVTASVLLLFAYALYAEVMRENAYLSRTIKVEEGQKVVDTGLYGVVRHPMYMATILLFLMMPLVLGSWYALIVFAFYPAIILVRLKNEEELLTRELPGYAAYREKVKYRILPFIWCVMTEKVYAFLKTIPKGKVATYGQIAAHLVKECDRFGNPGDFLKMSLQQCWVHPSKS